MTVCFASPDCIWPWLFKYNDYFKFIKSKRLFHRLISNSLTIYFYSRESIITSRQIILVLKFASYTSRSNSLLINESDGEMHFFSSLRKYFSWKFSKKHFLKQDVKNLDFQQITFSFSINPIAYTMFNRNRWTSL